MGHSWIVELRQPKFNLATKSDGFTCQCIQPDQKGFLHHSGKIPPVFLSHHHQTPVLPPSHPQNHGGSHSSHFLSRHWIPCWVLPVVRWGSKGRPVLPTQDLKSLWLSFLMHCWAKERVTLPWSSGRLGFVQPPLFPWKASLLIEGRSRRYHKQILPSLELPLAERVSHAACDVLLYFMKRTENVNLRTENVL